MVDFEVCQGVVEGKLNVGCPWRILDNVRHDSLLRLQRVKAEKSGRAVGTPVRDSHSM